MVFVQDYLWPKISAESDITYRSYCPPKTQKWAQMGPKPEKRATEGTFNKKI